MRKHSKSHANNVYRHQVKKHLEKMSAVDSVWDTHGTALHLHGVTIEGGKIIAYTSKHGQIGPDYFDFKGRRYEFKLVVEKKPTVKSVQGQAG